MGEPICISVSDVTEGFDLTRALAVRGLVGFVVPREPPQVVVDARREATSRLVADLFPALEEWGADRDSGPLRVEVGGTSYTVRSRLSATS
jgi:hypothetical protein